MADKKGTSHRSQLNRVKRVEGQVRGIARMIEEEKYCIDIIRQVRAIRAALKALELSIAEEHLNGCVGKRLGNKKDEKIEEIIALLKETGG